ncbi:unannotated protein [freshwater metagenome]|uniref:Unannotated protein n=1 Tax=freshwater metagenome TaxID=449393 RepID=A0A6J6YHF3_9ZZZZ
MGIEAAQHKEVHAEPHETDGESAERPAGVERLQRIEAAVLQDAADDRAAQNE